MGPRKSLAHRPKRSASSRLENEPSERRSKHRSDPREAPPPSRHPSPPPQASPPPPRVIPLTSRKLSTGRNIDFAFLEKENFDIGRKLKAQGWEYICSLNVPVYPNLVREFYGNAKTSHNLIESEVKSVKISLTPGRLSHILDTPCAGPDRLDDRLSGLRTVLERDDIVEFEEILANKLSVEFRLLHHIIARILLPRKGRFDFITKADLAFMHHIIQEIPFNFPANMIRVMQEAATRARPNLPYGMFLTLVFEEFSVDLEDEPIENIQHFDTYNFKSMKRLGFVKHQGVWLRKEKDARAAEEEEEEDDEEDEPRVSPVQPPSPSHPASSSVHPPVSVRLDDDQLEEIVQRVHSRMSISFQESIEAAVQRAFDRRFGPSSSSAPDPPLD